MIYDCFLFNNELEVLDIRLHELEKVVDRFVLVESTVSHSCKPKRLYFEENKERFKKFEDKIIHIIIRDTPEVSLPWIVNDYQFCQMIRGLKNCKDSDVILFGDADEIPRAERVVEWKSRKGKLKIFKQKLSQYYLNFVDYATGPWLGTRMTSYQHLKTYKSTWIAKFSKPDFTIPDAGWHFSYMGGIKRIREKLSNMTHQEYNNDKYNTEEHILQAVYKKKDFLVNKYKFRIAPITILPQYVQENTDLFSTFLLDKNQEHTSSLLFPYLEIKKRLRLTARNIRQRKR